MKKTVSTATALSTAIVIALGGIALSGPAASADETPPAPEVQVTSAAEPETATTDGQAPGSSPAAGSADPVAGPTAPAPVTPVETASPETASPGTDPVAADPVTTDPAEAGPAADVPGTPTSDATVDVAGPAPAAEAATFALESPVQGATYRTLSYVVVVLTDAIDVQVDVLDGEGQLVSGLVHASGPRIERRVGLADEAAAAQTVTVVVRDASGVLLWQETRTFTIDVPTSPRVTVDAPGADAVVTGTSGYPGIGEYAMTGTGVPGSSISYRLEALGGQEGWGHDYDPPRVGDDGTWRATDVLPYGPWRLRVSQYVAEGEAVLGQEGPQTSRSSEPVVVDFELVAPVPTPPAVTPTSPTPPTVVPVVATAVTPVATRVVPVAHRSGLASTGSSETTPWVGLAGMVLVGIGAATVLVTRRRASRG